MFVEQLCILQKDTISAWLLCWKSQREHGSGQEKREKKREGRGGERRDEKEIRDSHCQ